MSARAAEDLGSRAARIAVDYFDAGIRDEAARALRGAVRKAAAANPEGVVLDAARQAVEALDRNADNAGPRLVGLLKKKLRDLAEPLPDPRPKGAAATWADLDESEREEFISRAGGLRHELWIRREVEDGATHRDAQELMKRSGLSYDRLRISGEAIRLCETFSPNAVLSLRDITGDLCRRTFLDLAWASWDLGRGQHDLAKQRLGRLVHDAENELERQYQEREERIANRLAQSVPPLPTLMSDDEVARYIARFPSPIAS